MKKERCDCCREPLAGGTVKACYTLPGFVLQYEYCSESCKAEHRIKLMREAGL